MLELLTLEEFEQVVDDTLANLPEAFKKYLDGDANFGVQVEEYPDKNTMRLAGVRNPDQLLGFYHGVPRTERTAGYNMVLPDKISIYRQPLMRHYATRQELMDGIRHTVLHEIAHHFGITDERLRELGAY